MKRASKIAPNPGVSALGKFKKIFRKFWILKICRVPPTSSVESHYDFSGTPWNPIMISVEFLVKKSVKILDFSNRIFGWKWVSPSCSAYENGVVRVFWGLHKFFRSLSGAFEFHGPSLGVFLGGVSGAVGDSGAKFSKILEFSETSWKRIKPSEKWCRACFKRQLVQIAFRWASGCIPGSVGATVV